MSTDQTRATEAGMVTAEEREQWRREHRPVERQQWTRRTPNGLTLKTVCALCSKTPPCPTVRLLSALDQADRDLSAIAATVEHAAIIHGTDQTRATVVLPTALFQALVRRAATANEGA